MLGADDDGQARAVDVFVQETDQLLLLLDHLHERVQCLERQSLAGFEERRRAFDVDFLFVRQI